MTWRYSKINAGQIGGGGGVAPPLVVDFEAETIGDGVFTSDARYYRDANYELVAAAANTPRFQHLGSITQGILLERANFLWARHNRSLTTVNGWTHKDITQVSSTRPSVFGDNSAFEFDEGATVGVSHNVRRAITASGEAAPDNAILCVSAIVEYVDMPYLAVGIRAKSGIFPSQRFNINPDGPPVVAGTFTGAETQLAANMVYAGNNRYHVWTAYDINAGAFTPYMELLGADAGDTTVNYDGTNRKFRVHAFWIDEGVYPQMFYPVDAEPFGRAADVLVYSSAYQPANSFAVAVEFYGRDASQLSGTPAERFLYESGDFSIRITDDDFIADFNGSRLTHTATIQQDSLYKVAVNKNASGASLWVNEVEVDSDAGFTGAIVPGDIYPGMDSNGENHADCPIKKLTVGTWTP